MSETKSLYTPVHARRVLTTFPKRNSDSAPDARVISRGDEYIEGLAVESAQHGALRRHREA
eukprot:1858007-Pleurochrysis_carterae.AAC.2